MGRLVDRDDKYDYYSLSTTMLPSVKETVYEISSEYGDGKVLKK